MFCGCIVLQGHWTLFPPLPKGELPVRSLAVTFARTEQELGGESMQWWQEAMTAKPQSCFMLGQNSENSIPTVVRTGAMYRGRGRFTSGRDISRYTEMFLGRKGKRNLATGDLGVNVPSRELGA